MCVLVCVCSTLWTVFFFTIFIRLGAQCLGIGLRELAFRESAEKFSLCSRVCDLLCSRPVCHLVVIESVMRLVHGNGCACGLFRVLFALHYDTLGKKNKEVVRRAVVLMMAVCDVL